jgi:hypothetical protein
MSANMRKTVVLTGLLMILAEIGIVGCLQGVHRTPSAVPPATAQQPSETSAPAAVASQDKETDKPACLDCHGPYEELASAAPSFAFSPDLKINPHRYVPHDSKEIPDCAGCHAAHPVPPTEPVKKPTSVAWCYACHHTQDFSDCKQCH